MSLNDIVTLNIARSAAAVSRQGFGIALILGGNATGWSTDRIRSYSDPADMLTDGFTSSDAEYKAAQKLMGQPLKPTSFKVGRQLTAVAQVVTVTPTPADDTTFTETIDGVDYAFTTTTSATAADVVTGLAALINADADAKVTASGTNTLILTADTAGVSFTHAEGTGLAAVTTTANVGVATDLAEIAAIDDDWYALVIESRVADVIMEAAAYVETVRKIFVACSSDAAVIAAGATDVASRLKALAYTRTAYLYSADQANYPEAAALGNILPLTPGAWTLKFKTLTGITADALTSTQVTTTKAKKANIYTTVGGAGMVEEGVVASGEYLDVIVGIDWIHSNMQADIFQALRDNDKLPYTNPGAGVIEQIIRNRLRLAQLATILADDPDFVVTVPLVSAQDSADKAVRRLAGITFSATLAGAIHSTTINGKVEV